MIWATLFYILVALALLVAVPFAMIGKRKKKQYDPQEDWERRVIAFRQTSKRNTVMKKPRTTFWCGKASPQTFKRRQDLKNDRRNQNQRNRHEQQCRSVHEGYKIYAAVWVFIARCRRFELYGRRFCRR